ncbi:hypothetical protein M433DRAFT_130737 [Acidomyces richmondensis BFW]|nr:MAG: hypothetical protein FE78DRAFT_69843 [Acidomyces sp. 'richmondensis']KYG50004.1 hypothetical protein M433DRAFT_130737 [Acidomyces richmondensis BFW]
MLYYSGYTRRIGDVDEGSTITDFLPAERARGITIQSAAISFSWPPFPSADHGETSPRRCIPHNINLIDTPGHADFTFEVLRSLRVLDGAVCILDGVAGVEAQTEKVWAQAAAYAIPRIVYVNKLDRDGAAFGRTVKEVGAKLNVWPAVCGIPWWDTNEQLQGVGDVVGLRGLKYKQGGDGKEVEAFSLSQLESKDPIQAAELKAARVALTELLCEFDEELADIYLLFLEEGKDVLAISSQRIEESLRRCVLQHPQVVVPIFAGASFRNTGVQPLLDAVVDLLPAPDDRPDPEISLMDASPRGGLSEFLSGNLNVSGIHSRSKTASKNVNKEKRSFALQNLEACALAFKVVADPKRGVLVYIRVYSGIINRNAPLWNTNVQAMERAHKLLRMYGNEALEIDNIPAGQIGVIPGLKFARTGDTLVSYTGSNPKHGPPFPINSLQLRPIEVPPPVFFVSVEPNSLTEARFITDALDLLLREDPSLHVSIDEESGQTHLSGMGELHLEIARDRLIKDFKAKARIGNIEIGYRETVTSKSSQISETFDRVVGGKVSKASCTASVEPLSEGELDESTGGMHVFDLPDQNRLIISTPTLHSDGTPIDEETQGLPEDLPMATVLQALQNGVFAALARGPTYNYPIHSTQINIFFDPSRHISVNTSASALASATRLSVQRALKESAKVCETAIMEPVMRVTISVDENSLGSVVHDISSARGGSIVSLGTDDTSSISSQESEAKVDVSKIYAPRDPFAGGFGAALATVTSGPAMKQVVARVPLKEMVGYLKHLRSLTGGKGTFTMVVDRFEKMSGVRQRKMLSEMSGGY